MVGIMQTMKLVAIMKILLIKWHGGINEFCRNLIILPILDGWLILLGILIVWHHY